MAQYLREFYMPGSDKIDNYVGTDKDKITIFVEGVCAQSNMVNRNGRFYPMAVLERECKKVSEQASKDVLCGGLEHPEQPAYSLAQSAFRILSVKQDPKEATNFLIKGKLIESKDGQTAIALAKEGLKFGVSSRALGTLVEHEDAHYVQDDLNILCWDLVHDPSAPQAYLKTFMENFKNGVEYFLDEKTGYIKESRKAQTLLDIVKSAPRAQLDEAIEKAMRGFLASIKI